ncbi:MAG TPA: hypothetical protein VFN09_02125 [Rhodanobacteraceae bacterium]|nr:hypothetical protein [Rhodanobacteraceae bacterium]
MTTQSFCGSALVAACLFLAAHAAGAQQCAVPQSLAPNTAISLDTCAGDQELHLACGSALELYGPAAVFQLDLPYPAGTLNLQPVAFAFSPALLVMQAPCSGLSPCYAAAMSPPGTGSSVDLSGLDSGSYFVVVAPLDGVPGPGNCGPAFLLWDVLPDDLPLLGEGMFRAGYAPVWSPPVAARGRNK